MTWAVLGDSVTGTSHRMRDTRCQDAHRYRSLGPAGEWLVIAVADGAGSASHSEAGAALACEEFVRRVEAIGPAGLLESGAMTALFGDVRAALIAEAKRLELRPREMACTALLAIIGPECAATAQLGDGGIVFGDGQDYRVAFWPEPVEYANATDFLTDDQFADAVRFETTTTPVSEIALLTDGLQRLALDFTTKTPHTAFFAPLFKEVRTASDPSSLAEPFRAFLDSPRVNERTDDDKTLVIAVRRP